MELLLTEMWFISILFHFLSLNVTCSLNELHLLYCHSLYYEELFNFLNKINFIYIISNFQFLYISLKNIQCDSFFLYFIIFFFLFLIFFFVSFLFSIFYFIYFLFLLFSILFFLSLFFLLLFNVYYYFYSFFVSFIFSFF